MYILRHDVCYIIVASGQTAHAPLVKCSPSCTLVLTGIHYLERLTTALQRRRMSIMAFHIMDNTTVCSTAFADEQQSKRQSSALLTLFEWKPRGYNQWFSSQRASNPCNTWRHHGVDMFHRLVMIRYGYHYTYVTSKVNVKSTVVVKCVHTAIETEWRLYIKP